MFSFITQILKSLTPSKMRALAPRAYLSVERLEDRTVPTVGIAGQAMVSTQLLKTLPPPDPTAVWIDANIHDATIHSLVRQLDADHVLSRNDMLQVFQTVSTMASKTSSGINATQLSDLHALVAASNSAILGMPGYVQNLANKVVNCDPADSTFQGWSLAPEPNGLQVGDSARLTEMTEKWFLGQDHPLIPSTVLFGGKTVSLQYTNASGTLFGSGVSYMDVQQGEAGDCYVMSPLVDTAIKSPSIINSMFIDNGDGTYTVRFYNQGVADYVTVDRYLPTTSSGEFVYANIGQYGSNSANKLWVPLVEKAYAELDASGWNGRPSIDQTNSYAGLDDGPSVNGLEQVTGHPATLGTTIANSQATALEANFVAGHEIVFSTAANIPMSNVIPNHVYAMYSYFGSGSSAIFVLANPWGQNATENGQSAGMLYMTLDQMSKAGFTSYADANMAASFPIYVHGIPIAVSTTTIEMAAAPVNVTADVTPPATPVPVHQAAPVFSVKEMVPAASMDLRLATLFFEHQSHDQAMVADDLVPAWLARREAEIDWSRFTK